MRLINLEIKEKIYLWPEFKFARKLTIIFFKFVNRAIYWVIWKLITTFVVKKIKILVKVIL